VQFSLTVAAEPCSQTSVFHGFTIPGGAMRRYRTHVVHLTVLATFASVLVPVRLSDASCNLIPSATTTFRGALGSTDRPFASPGEFVEVRVRPQVCDAASPGFAPADIASNFAVTLVFTPPFGGPRNIVVLATNCPFMGAPIGPCAGAATTRCVPAAANDLAIVARNGERRLQFRFPDTDLLADGLDDGRTFAGPATIAVTTLDDAPACGPVTGSCTTQSGLIACIDDIFELDGTCRTQPTNLNPVFGHFTALPPPNRYADVCTEPPILAGGPCTGLATEVRFAVDTAGNILLPVDWQGVLVQSQNVPVPRLLRAGTSVEALGLGSGPLQIPGPEFVASYTPQGALLPPIFTPQVDPSAPNELTLFG
jgi:hypothetical protein